jgi:hypothetical protein
MVEFEVAGNALDVLVALGWLGASSRGDRDAVRTAIVGLAERALAMRAFAMRGPR